MLFKHGLLLMSCGSSWQVPSNLGLSHSPDGQVLGIEPEQVASTLVGSLLRAAAEADVQQACSVSIHW
jgi:hypothetical protein